MSSTFEYIDSAYSSSEASSDILNIRIGPEELSYYINDAQSKILIQRHFKLGANLIEDLLNHLDHSDLQNPFLKVRVSIDEAYTIIPSDIFRPIDILFHFKNNLGESATKDLQFDQLKTEGIVLVYGIEKELLHVLESKFTDFEYYNAHTVLLNSIYKENEKKDKIKNAFINFRENDFSYTILKNQKLIYSNTFKYKTAEDCLYFIVRASNELKVDLNIQECIFSGGIEHTDKVYKLLNDYLNKIEFVKRPSDLGYSDEHYRRLPSNAFFDLYSMSRCA